MKLFIGIISTIGFSVMSGAKCNHAKRFIMCSNINWRIEMMIFQVGAATTIHRTSKTNFFSQGKLHRIRN